MKAEKPTMLPDKEIESLWSYIRRSVDRILACLDGLDEDDLNWRPLDSANSLYVLAVHMMANVEANILGVLCFQNIVRHRDEEFKARGSSVEPVLQRWRDVQERVSLCLMKLSSVDLDREYEHPRRSKITGRDLLITVARHAAEHVGHAELTRDLLYTTRGRELPKREW
jgi:uncharacterized damage-inducible protein DinB